MDIHFVRVTHNSQTNEKKEAILFLHGWPSSFIEYLDVARLLNSSTSSTYDLIIPSLPGYGYSDAPVRPGMNPSQIARIMQNLMQRLGHSSYVVCGGDWGAVIGTSYGTIISWSCSRTFNNNDYTIYDMETLYTISSWSLYKSIDFT